MRSATLLALAFSCPLLTRIHGQGSGLQTVQLDIDLAQRHDISPELYGIFFEEISHAGDGGLYAELVQDRAFDAMALQSGALSNNADRWLITEERLAAGRTALQTRMSASKQAYLERNASHGSRAWWLQQQQLPGSSTGSHGLADQFTEEVAWTPLTPSTQLSIMRDPGLVNSTAHRKLSLAVSSNGTNAAVGVVNSGYWGIPVDSGSTFVLSMRIKQLKVSDMAAEAPTTVVVSLQSKDGHVKYASTTFTNISTTWQQLSATLTTETSGDAQLAIEAQGGADVALEFVSLLPATNVQAQGNMQNPFPFRADLLQMLRDLKPRFLRMPGGCYVEGGDHLANAFRWKETLGEVSRRPGHLNAIWGYWSTDGLGIFEYMLLAEELKAEPVWVFNSGNSHTEYIPNDKLHPFVEDVLQSIEFVTGSPDSTWGGMRAAMGHPEPWELNFMAIGNEDCGMWQYLENYHTFFAAIRERYPKIQLIADCDLTGQAPQDLWDWHIYTSAQDLFNKQHEFDNAHPGVFASEYAVTHDAGFGNLKAAVAEAAFMTGLERNSPTVRMASYAPLLVNTHNRAWGPDAIVFNTRKAYGIPSYYVQQMFAENMGIAYASSNLKITFGDIHSVFTAASTTCLDSACKQIAIKVINFATFDQDVAISIAGLPAGHAIVPDGEVTTLTASYPEVENSFEHPFNIAPSIKPLGVPGPNFSFTAKGFSVSVLKLKLTDNGCALSHTEA